MLKKMIRQFVLILLTAHVLVLPTYGKPVSLDTAKRIAEKHIFPQSEQMRSKGLVPEAKEAARVFTVTRNSRNIYYVVNLDPEGWMIISADDVAYPIIAYSDIGTYMENGRPPGFDAWMENVKAEIYDAIETGLTALSEAENAWASLDSPDLNAKSIVVGPLIQTTWDQGGTGIYSIWLPSYDLYCPAERNASWGTYRVAPTGCVATALGQIMKYWSWPPSGKGYHSYTTSYTCDSTWPNECYGYGERSADFSSRTYDWGAMPGFVWKRISGTHTAGEQQVQQLMYDLGVAVNMDYRPTESGAFGSVALAALKEFFRYSSCAKYKSKGSDSTTWKENLKTELNEGRPIYYRGSDGGPSGHAFICDGYDTNGSFHFNWGWGGSHDGWFYVTGLTPGSYNFSKDQSAFFNLKPATPDLVITKITTDPLVPSPGQRMSFYITVKNIGEDDITESIRIGFRIFTDRVLEPDLDDDYEIGEYRTIESLAVGEETSLSVSNYEYNSQGIKSVWAIVDSTELVDESDEQNNVFGPVNLAVEYRGLVGEYRMDGNVDDTSGNENHGTFLPETDTPSFVDDPDGNQDMAMELQAGQYISVPHTEDYNFGDSAFTLAAWVKTIPDTSPSKIMIISKGLIQSGFKIGYALSLIGDRLYLELARQSPSAYYYLLTTDGAAIPDDDQWHHVAVTRDIEGGVYFYVDGVAYQVSGTWNFDISNPCTNYPQGNHHPTWIGFQGMVGMDDARLYGKALTLEEIRMIGVDMDNDGVENSVDNCPDVANTDQENHDEDLFGDVCDPCPYDAENDADLDGICADEDICPLDRYNDEDGDGICGDVDICPGGDDNVDSDNDGVPDHCDDCPYDFDGDGDTDGHDLAVFCGTGDFSAMARFAETLGKICGPALEQ